jgi:hypothetical protein
MSDLVPGPNFDGIVRVVKLINGDELLGIVRDATPDRIILTLPAKLETAQSRDKNNTIIEYVKLTNYAINVVNYEITINRNSILYMALPIPELNKLYETFFLAMQKDPSSIISNSDEEIFAGPEAGLQMLNELFNNEDFVNFVNDLIDSFEGVEMVLDSEEEENSEEEEEEEPNLFLESPINDSIAEEAPKPSKSKKRTRMNPETKDIPFNPEGNPDSAESWSDNPEDYI